jgi:hypothetical protein
MTKMPRRQLVTNRFWSKVDRSDPHGCWPWMASVNKKGYGQFMNSDTRRPQRANRVAYELMCGPIPDGMMVCHRCDNPRCCNPAHLFLGTAFENTNDMVLKGRAKGARGAKHHSTKLTAEDVHQIRAAVGDHKDIAAKFNISRSYVWNIKAGRKWAHLPMKFEHVH